MSTLPTVAVVFGGRSSEHGVSCTTAGGVLGAIDRTVWNVVAVGITPTGRWTRVSSDPNDWIIVDGEMQQVDEDGDTVFLPVEAGKNTWLVQTDSGVQPFADVNVVFPVLHGPWGEDGTLQGALDLIDVKYVGSGVLSSAMGMDKQFMKMAFRDAGLQVAPGVVLAGDQEWDVLSDEIAALGIPLFVKPARAGSSMGISKVKDFSDLAAAIEAAREHDPKVLIEGAVVGREIEAAVLQTAEGLRVGELGEIVTSEDLEFYDYEAKYLESDSVDLVCPADVTPEVRYALAETAIKAFRAVDAEGLARVDCFVAEDGTITVNEINTMPGFTTTSMYPRMWAEAGMDYPELVQALLQSALDRGIGLR